MWRRRCLRNVNMLNERDIVVTPGRGTSGTVVVEGERHLIVRADADLETVAEAIGVAHSRAQLIGLDWYDVKAALGGASVGDIRADAVVLWGSAAELRQSWAGHRDRFVGDGLLFVQLFTRREERVLESVDALAQRIASKDQFARIAFTSGVTRGRGCVVFITSRDDDA